VLVSRNTKTRDLFVSCDVTADILMLCSSIYTSDITTRWTNIIGTKVLLWKVLFQFLGPWVRPFHQNTSSDLAQKQTTCELVDTGSVTKFSEYCVQFRKRWYENSFFLQEESGWETKPPLLQYLKGPSHFIPFLLFLFSFSLSYFLRAHSSLLDGVSVYVGLSWRNHHHHRAP